MFENILQLRADPKTEMVDFTLLTSIIFVVHFKALRYSYK